MRYLIYLLLFTLSPEVWAQTPAHRLPEYQEIQQRLARGLGGPAVAFSLRSRDGSTFAAVIPGEEVVRVWDAATGERRRDIPVPDIGSSVHPESPYPSRGLLGLSG